MSTLVGLVVMFGCVLAGFAMGGGPFPVLFQPAELVVIGGATKSGLRSGQVSGVFAHGATALMKPDEPFAAENRRLSILAARRGMEKVAARGEDSVEEKQPKPKPCGAGASVPAAKPEPTAD